MARAIVMTRIIDKSEKKTMQHQVLWVVTIKSINGVCEKEYKPIDNEAIPKSTFLFVCASGVFSTKYY